MNAPFKIVLRLCVSVLIAVAVGVFAASYLHDESGVQEGLLLGLFVGLVGFSPLGKRVLRRVVLFALIGAAVGTGIAWGTAPGFGAKCGMVIGLVVGLIRSGDDLYEKLRLAQQQPAVPRPDVNSIVVLLMIGITLYVLGATASVSALQRIGWSAISAKIIGTAIDVESAGFVRGTIVPLYHYVPEIAYSYKIGGIDFAHKDALPTPSSSHAEAQARLKKFPAGQSMIVFYNPQNPRESDLTKGQAPWSAIVLLVSGVLVQGGAVIAARRPASDSKVPSLGLA